MRTTLLSAGILGAATAAVLALAGPAAASDTIAGDTTPVVLAQDTSPAPATIPASIVGIDADLVAGLTVTGHQGRKVTATARGRTSRTSTVAAGRPAVLKGLTPGVRYTITIGGRRVGTATPLAQVGAASGLRVETTGTPGTVQVSWAHTVTAGEGPDVSFDVTATPLTADGSDGAAIVAATASTTPAMLTGLAPGARYRFTVTPRNTASAGRPTSATMARTLAELAGGSGRTPSPAATIPAVPVPAVTAPATPVAAAAPAPGPAPAPAPPATKTIYVCPGGYTETPAGVCEKTLPFTFHTVTETSPYTYHQEYAQTGWAYSWGYCTGSGNSGNWPNGDPYCQSATFGYNDVKNAPPSGFGDDGTQYVRTTSVKDTPPVGYADNGTAWVATSSKIATVVPA
ncbi:MAG: fibronectin type III domain-containing protein [Actinobacteria bacterium]|nr:fibronectin type III domain-containing protein [Actinomycetota bacterium]